MKARSFLMFGWPLMLVSLLVGCAKHPAMTTATAPSPTPTRQAVVPASHEQAPAPTPAAPAVTAAPATRPSPKEFVANPALKDVYFAFDRAEIRPEDAKTLETNAEWLRTNPGYLVLIEGHTDERGTSEYNTALGDRRAKAAANFLVSHGVKADRLTTLSYGKERPVCTEHNEGCWAKNRHDHFLVKPM